MKIAEVSTELKPHQQRVIDRIKQQPGLVVAHGMGSGKAQPLYAKVLTPTGWTTMGELRAGDFVVGSDGRPTEVVGVYPQGELEVFQVVMSDGATTTCCDDHLWEVNTAKRLMRGAPARVKPLRELRERLTDKHRNRQHFIPMVAPVQFGERRLPLHPYLLGVLLGDGSVVRGTPALSSADEELVQRVRELVPAGIVVKKNKGAKYDYYLSSGSQSRSNILTGILRSLGVWGRHSWEKSIPMPYLHASVGQRLDLLQGLMDTDGYGNRSSAQFCSTSRELAEGVRELVMSLGGCATVSTKKSTHYTHKGERRAGRVAYSVNIRILTAVPLFRLGRKLKKLGVRTKYVPTRSIAEVLPLGRALAQCIKVAAADQLYVTDDYIVTHNTLTSIAAAEAMGGPTTVLAPAALQSNYRKEIAKHVTGDHNAQFDIGSLQRAALSGEIAPAKTLIVDEAHRLRDPGSMARKAVRDAEVEKRLLLTGTALYNRPYDLASLVNVAAGDNVFPGTQADFDRQYIGEKVTDPGWFAKTFRGVKPGSTPTLKNEKQLGDILQKWVDYHENNTEGFPTRHDETVNVDMSPKQQELYDFSMGKAPAWVKYKIQHGLPPSKAESKDLNAFSGAVRQVSVSPGGFSKEMSPEEAASYSPKIQEAYKRLAAGIAANPQHRAVVYSNFLDSGLSPYESLLKQHNVPYGKFTGDVKPADRDKMVSDYNSGALKALLLSSAGGEGLDLKGTRQIQVLEPHWNKEKLEQVIARGIRYKSHEALPEDQRSVNVEHYMSQMPEPGALRKLLGAKRPGAIDSYLEMMSKDKDNLNQQVRELLKKTDQAPAKTAGVGKKIRAALDPRRIAGDLLGSVHFEHGTGHDAATKIRREGFSPEYGGIAGGGSENQQYRGQSKGKVHVSAPVEVGLPSTAPRYAAYGASNEAQVRLGIPLDKVLYDEIPEHVAIIDRISAEAKRTPGEVITGAMPFRQFKKDFAPDTTMLGDAFHTAKPIGPQHFGTAGVLGDLKGLWQHRDRDFGAYVRENPKRFMRGAAIPAGLGLLAVGGGGALWHQHQKAQKKTDQTPAAPKTAGAYLNHTALNLGLATHDVRHFGNHPAADDVAEKGTAKHVAASVTSRIPSLAANLYYAALPPQLHHTKEDLEEVRQSSPMDWFMHGYSPEHPSPTKSKMASLGIVLEEHCTLVKEAAKIPVMHGTFARFPKLVPAVSSKVLATDPNPQGIYMAMRRRSALPSVERFATSAAKRHGGTPTVAYARVDTQKGWVPHQLTEWGKKNIGDLDDAADVVMALEDKQLSKKERGELWKQVQKGIGSWKNQDLSTPVLPDRYRDVR